MQPAGWKEDNEPQHKQEGNSLCLHIFKFQISIKVQEGVTKIRIRKGVSRKARVVQWGIYEALRSRCK